MPPVTAVRGFYFGIVDSTGPVLLVPLGYFV